MTEKGVGQADKVYTRIFAKEGIYKSAGVFYAKANKLKYEIRENYAVIIDLKRHNAQ